eukprot:6198423-Pleurochrysis_carterae.AAC.1
MSKASAHLIYPHSLNPQLLMRSGLCPSSSTYVVPLWAISLGRGCWLSVHHERNGIALTYYAADYEQCFNEATNTCESGI